MAGMFGGSSEDGGFDMKQALVMALNGYLASQGNPAGQFGMKLMLDKLAAQREQAQYQRKREDDWTDWRKQYDYEVKNPKATAPHYFESNSGDQYAIGADGKPVEVFHDPMRYKFVPNGMGGVVPVDIGALMSGGQGGPQVGSVIDDPRKAGGPAVPPPATFPPYYR